LVANIGVNVRATNEEIATEPAITILNSLNKRPVIPSINTIGKNTEIRVIVVDTTAKKISFDPSIPASFGDMPCSIRTYIFSATTIASSTTRPTESTTANIVNTLTENPEIYITKKAPTNDTGITTTGTSVTRQSRRNKKIINTTKRKAS